MTTLIDKTIPAKQLEAFLAQQTYNDVCKKEFVAKLHQTLQEEEGQENEEGYVLYLLNFIASYISIFEAERKNGYSEAWARKYADHLSFEDENEAEKAVAIAYDYVLESSEETAKQDLQNFIEKNGLDGNFKRHFHFLITMKESHLEPSVINKTKLYAEVYKKQLSEGESVLFANHYADLIASQDVDELA